MDVGQARTGIHDIDVKSKHDVNETTDTSTYRATTSTYHHGYNPRNGQHERHNGPEFPFRGQSQSYRRQVLYRELVFNPPALSHLK